MSATIVSARIKSLGMAAMIGAAALAVSLASPAAVAAGNSQSKVAKVHHIHRVHRAYVARDASGFAQGARPPYGYIPPDAIVMPGYVFVPGVGILGESCDLPTSSCDNAYRDIQ